MNVKFHLHACQCPEKKSAFVFLAFSTGDSLANYVSSILKVYKNKDP